MSAQNDYTPVQGSASTSSAVAVETRSIISNAVDKAKDAMPDVSHLYLQPLDPASELSFGDRASLVWQSSSSWGEFFNLRAMNLPPLGEVRTRMGNNVETYFYNYFLLTCLHVLFFAFGHLGSLLYMIAWVAVVYYMFVAHPETVEIGKVSIDEKGKWIIAIVCGLLAVFVGNGLSLIFSVLWFIAIVVGIHSAIRDDSLDGAPLVGV